MTVDLPFQFDFILNLTFRCNLRCEMCTQYGKDYKEQAVGELNVNDWIKFFEELREINPKPKLILMGGEPFLYKDFDTLFKTAHEFGLQTHIITNGFYLDKHIDILKDTDTDITISIDGLGKIHDSIRGSEGLFDKVVNNIRLISKYQKDGSKMKLRINHVMLPENINNLIEFHEFFKDFDVETFTFQHIQSSSANLNNLSKEQWRKRLNQNYCTGLIPNKEYKLDKEYANSVKTALNKFKAYNHSHNCFVFPALEDEELIDYYTNNNLDNLRKNMVCCTPWLNPAINPNGDVFNCIGNAIGNIKEESFWDIWNSEKAQKLRTALTKDGKFTICTKCCCFYKGNFIPAVDGKTKINGIKMQLPDELNYVQSSKKIAFVKDNKIEKETDYIPAIPVNIHSDEIMNQLKKEYEIITITE